MINKKLALVLCFISLFPFTCKQNQLYAAFDATCNYPTALDTTETNYFDKADGDPLYHYDQDVQSDAIIKLETKLGYNATSATQTPADTYILIGTGSGTSAWVSMTGDIAITNTGVTTIQDDQVTKDMLYVVGGDGSENDCLTTVSGSLQWQNCSAAAGATIITDVYSCNTGDCSSIALADGDLFDASLVNCSSTTEGIILPQTTSCASAILDGQICWDTDDNRLYVGDGATAIMPVASDLVCSGCVNTTDILDSTIASADIAADTIVAADIATGAVETTEILDGTIVAVDIASNAITNTKILNDTIGTAKLDFASTYSAGSATQNSFVTINYADSSKFENVVASSGTNIANDLEEEAHAGGASTNEHAVSGADSVYPTDPNADGILFWDDGDSSLEWAAIGTGLSYDGTTLTATGGGGAGDYITAGIAYLYAVDDTTDYFKAYNTAITTVADAGDFRLPMQFTFQWDSFGGGTEPRIETDTYDNLSVTVADADALEVNAGNLHIGNQIIGVGNDVTLNGEDAWIEGTLEVDGAARFDGAVTYGSSTQPTMTFDDSNTSDHTDDATIYANAIVTTSAAEDVDTYFNAYVAGALKQYMHFDADSTDTGGYEELELGNSTDYLTVRQDGAGCTIYDTDNGQNSITIGDGVLATSGDRVGIASYYWTVAAATGNMVTSGTLQSGALTSTGAITATSGVNLGTSQALIGTTAMTIGNNAQTVAINSSDWDISTTGIATGMGNITSDGTIEGATLTEGGNAVYNSSETPGGELGGTWASPTIDDSVAVTSWQLTTPIVVDASTLTFDESAANPNDADVALSAADGVLTIASVNGDNNENLTIDTDATSNVVSISSGTSATLSIAVATDVDAALSSNTLAVDASNDPYLKLDEDTAGQADWVIGTDSTEDSLEFRTNDTVGNSVVMEIYEDGEVSFDDANDPYLMLDETDGTDWYLGVDDTGNSIELRTDATVGYSVMMEVAESTGNVSFTGSVSGKIPVTSVSSLPHTVTTAQTNGGFLIVTAAGDVDLPDVCGTASGAHICVMERDAGETVSVAVGNSSDAIVFAGTNIGTNQELDSPGGAADYACFACLEANVWYVLDYDGTWTDGGNVD